MTRPGVEPGWSPNGAEAGEYFAWLRSPRRRPRPLEPVESIEEMTAPGDIPVRVCHPLVPARRPGILVYLHGGGWVSGDLEMHDATCRTLANALGWIVVNVDYRLAPEHPYPAALDDTLAAIRACQGWATDWGVDPADVAVGGSSAGGNLAAAACICLRDEGALAPAAQLLLYPILDAGCNTPSFAEFGSGYLLSAEEMRLYWNAYVPSVEDRERSEAAPARATELAGLPAAVLVVPELDVLRDEALAYSARLRAAGVSVDELVVEGQIHGFLAALAEADESRQALRWAADRLKAALPDPGKKEVVRGAA